jgi:4-hydroxy-3-polyprenylbenzoate decarboxylase
MNNKVVSTIGSFHPYFAGRKMKTYKTLEDSLNDLEKMGQLIRIKEEVDPYLEMAAIHLRVRATNGQAILFENIKGSKYRAASNIFGTIERSRFIFRDTINVVKMLIDLKNEPIKAWKQPFNNLKTIVASINAFPLKLSSSKTVFFEKITLADLPQIHHWKKDGGAFITLPQVYSEDPEIPGIMHANLGMYRVQISGNDYQKNEEAGIHYQIHRGIGVHQFKAMKKGVPLKVSIFVGGPPAHTLAAVMPLPEGLSELSFAGVLSGRRFRYFFEDDYCLSADADFVITGEITNETKPEGPFGDHLGYYSLTHDFPVMKVKQVYAKKNAIWPFTVVGRPPQEDTSFGALIHEMSGKAIEKEIPGLKEIHAVDAAGVHPLLLAIGSERYTPFDSKNRPAELLTVANHILGTGQLSLAKYLLICADEKNLLHTHDVEAFFMFILERIDFSRDLHFHTNTTIDTLDYSGEQLNMGSKLVMAAYGNPIRDLCREIAPFFHDLNDFKKPRMIFQGVIAIQANVFLSYEKANEEMNVLCEQLKNNEAHTVTCPLLIVCDDSEFVSSSINNFLWITFTRSNPSHDVYGVNSNVKNKHWSCDAPLIIDARKKPHHAPELEWDEATERKIDRLFEKAMFKK